MLIFPVTKRPTARIGKREWQDWYRVCKIVAQKVKNESGSRIILPVNSTFQGKEEINYYKEAFKELDVERSLLAYKKCQETICQIKETLDIASREGVELIAFATWLHWPRVKYLYWTRNNKGVKVKVYPVFGIPSPPTIVKDITLIFLIPLIDIFEYLWGSKKTVKWIQKQAKKSRKK